MSDIGQKGREEGRGELRCHTFKRKQLKKLICAHGYVISKSDMCSLISPKTSPLLSSETVSQDSCPILTDVDAHVGYSDCRVHSSGLRLHYVSFEINCRCCESL